MSFFGRVIAWFAEDVIVKTLSRSPRFQRLALKIDSYIHHTKTLADEHVVQVGKKAINENMEKVKATANVIDLKKFADTFHAEVKKEMQNIKSGK